MLIVSLLLSASFGFFPSRVRARVTTLKEVCRHDHKSSVSLYQ
jgi:hypothetical protein